MTLPFELFVALRFLREGRSQTWLLVGATSVGVTVLVFLSALITGLEQRIIERTLGGQAHVVIKVQDEEPRRLTQGEAISARVEPAREGVAGIDDVKTLAARVADIDGVDGVAASATGAAVAVRGQRTRAITLRGVDPADFDRVYRVAERMTQGAYVLSGHEAMIGVVLAQELGLGVGDTLRLERPGARGERFVVRGIFDLGAKDVNQRWVLTPLRSAQTLLGLGAQVTGIDVHLRDIFAADRVAAQAAARTGLVAESWMVTNVQLLSALKSQRSSRDTIEFFIALAVALGIASVLVVSVVQKTGQIGILRATGTSRAQVLRIFLWQGLLVSTGGGLVGCALGFGLTLVFTRVRNLDGTPLLPIQLSGSLFSAALLLSAVVGLAAAALPSRRAASLDPAKAMRHV